MAKVLNAQRKLAEREMKRELAAAKSKRELQHEILGTDGKGLVTPAGAAYSPQKPYPTIDGNQSVFKSKTHPRDTTVRDITPAGADYDPSSNQWKNQCSYVLRKYVPIPQRF